MQALGTVEVIGLTAGIEAADVACKTANVELIGYELAKGGGLVTIKVTGQVAAVSAAMDAAAEAAARIGRVVSKLVIPRPSEQIARLIHNPLTRGYTPPAEEAPAESGEPAAPAATQETSEAPASDTAATAKSNTTRRKES